MGGKYGGQNTKKMLMWYGRAKVVNGKYGEKRIT
jgi:hypothetical protein